MSAPRIIVQSFISHWKVKSLLALPIFVAAMWYGIAHQFDDMALYAVAMTIASWEIASGIVHVVLKWQEWQTSRRKNFEEEGISADDEFQDGAPRKS